MPRKKLTVSEELEQERNTAEHAELGTLPENPTALPTLAEDANTPDFLSIEEQEESPMPEHILESFAPADTSEEAAALTVEHVDLEPSLPVETPLAPSSGALFDAADPVESPADTTPHQASKSDRQRFYELDFHELDRDLSPEEQQEWNSIYASYRGQSALTGTIIGVDQHSVSVRNPETGKLEQHTMYCAIVVPYRVRIVIPAPEMWQSGAERPAFVLQNMVGATIDFVIIKVDREGGFAIGSRRRAASSRRYYFAHRPALSRPGARLTCRILAVGPRRCLVECHGYDLNLTQRDLRYTAIPDLRDVYHPGQELPCLVKTFEAESGSLEISVKETEPNPFIGAELRHPVGCRRQAAIAGKYGGGVFCNLPDGTVCMCNYSHQHEDSDFMVGDTVILVVQRYEQSKQQMYGKILAKW